MKKQPSCLCRCKKPDFNIIEGHYNCGRAYVVPCRKCGKNLKFGKEDYSYMTKGISKIKPMILTEENSKNSIEDRITYLLSEWLNDQAPLGQERYREPAKAVLREIEAMKKNMAHLYNWRESAIHGIRGAKALCGHEADPSKPLKLERQHRVAKDDSNRCAKCVAASKKKRSKK